MFYWDPVIHQSEPGHEWEEKLRRTWSLSTGKCMQRTHHEHDRFMAEFTSLLAGIETTLAATGMHIQRLDDEGLFLLITRGVNPFCIVKAFNGRNGRLGPYESIRNRLTSVSIEGESDDYLKVGGFLYTFVR